jgi:hypothetical protein
MLANRGYARISTCMTLIHFSKQYCSYLETRPGLTRDFRGQTRSYHHLAWYHLSHRSRPELVRYLWYDMALGRYVTSRLEDRYRKPR